MRTQPLALTLALPLVLLFFAEPPQPRAAVPPPLLPIRVLSVHDGDTLRADILFPWGVTLRDRALRTNYDCWEVNRTRQTVKVTEEEIRRGKACLAEFQALLQSASAVYVSPGAEEYGDYNRLSVVLWVERPRDGTLLDVARWMADRGHLRPASLK